MAKFIEADVIQKIATEAEWLTQTRIPYKGQIMIVSDSVGKVTNIKVGDGVNPFADLNYMFDSIQQNAQYVPIAGNSLPTPSVDPAWGMVTEGTYTFGGTDVFTVPDGHWGIANYSSGVWSLVDMGELPSIPVDGVVEEGNPNAVSGGEVWEKTVTNESNRALPVGNEFLEIDRPDLVDNSFFIIDENNNIIFEAKDPEITIWKDIDRPDINDVIFVDEEGYAFNYNPTNGGSVDDKVVKNLISDDYLRDVFFEPEEQPSYNFGSSNNQFWIDYDYFGLFDEIFENQKTAVGYEPYITKTLVGSSTEGDMPVYQYEFKPKFPTRKIILIGGTHGSERIPPLVLKYFFNELCTNWMNNEALKWIKNNVHIVCIPLASPYGFHYRKRRLMETAPFPATWTKSGNVVTISFNVNDFPTTNDNVSASDYFSNPNIINKTWVSCINTGSPLFPDDGYEIKGIINGQTITVNTDIVGDGSGTCDIYVSTDPARNFTSDLYSWDAVISNRNNLQTYGEAVAVPFDNKGTKPFSVNESVIIKELIDENTDATFGLDIHNGSGDYDTRSYTINDLLPIEILNAKCSSFTDKVMPINTTYLQNTPPTYGQAKDINFLSIEWGEYNLITEEEMTNAARWFCNYIIHGARFYNNKLNK